MTSKLDRVRELARRYRCAAVGRDADELLVEILAIVERLVEQNTDYYERLTSLENSTDETETRLRGLLRSAEKRAEQAERDLAEARRKERQAVMLSGLDAADFVARENELRAEVEQVRNHNVKLQQHRDRWRSHAYGRGPRPQDFLDGNMVEQDRGPTCAEEIERLRAELDEAEKRADEGFRRAGVWEKRAKGNNWDLVRGAREERNTALKRIEELEGALRNVSDGQIHDGWAGHNAKQDWSADKASFFAGVNWLRSKALDGQEESDDGV